MNEEIIFLYDASFKENDIKWASRWGTYLLMNDNLIQNIYGNTRYNDIYINGFLITYKKRMPHDCYGSRVGFHGLVCQL